MSERVRLLQLLGAAALAAAALAGCGGGGGGDGGGGGGGSGQEVVVELEPVGPEGAGGSASFTTSGDQTNVLIDILLSSGVGGQIASLHKGTCAKFTPEAAYDLGPVEEGVGGTTLDVPEQTLLDGGYVVVVHSSATDPAPIACGPLKAA